MHREDVELVRSGLYEQLLTIQLQQDLDGLADPRLCYLAPIDPDDSHSIISQYLEHLLANGLASFRGSEASERQKRLVDRIIHTLVDELGDDWTNQISIASPLRRLLAIHGAVTDSQ